MIYPTKRVPIRPHRPIEDTLLIMARLVRAKRDHQVVREMGTSIAAGCPPLDDVCRMRRARAWVAGALRYEKDPRGADLLQDPVMLIEKIQRQGSAAADCDDSSLLLSTLLETVGIQTRFAAISTRPDKKLHHVAVEAKDGRTGRWHWLDGFSGRLQVPPTSATMRVNV